MRKVAKRLDKPKVYTFKQQLARLRKRLVFFIIAFIILIISFIMVFAEEFYRGSRKYFDNIAVTRITNTGGMTEKSIIKYFNHCSTDMHNFLHEISEADMRTGNTIDEEKLKNYLNNQDDGHDHSYHLESYGVVYNNKIYFPNSEPVTTDRELLLSAVKKEYIITLTEDDALYFISPSPQAYQDFTCIIGKIDLEEFSREIETNVYGGQANVLVIRNNGETVAVSSIHNEDWYGDNFYQDIANNYPRKDYDRVVKWLQSSDSKTIEIGANDDYLNCMIYKRTLDYGDEGGKLIFVLAVQKKLLTNQVVSLTNISLTALYISLVGGTSVIIMLVILLARNHIQVEKKKAYGPKSGLLTEDYFFRDAQAILFHDNSPFGLVSMNIRGFKKINAIYGADVADKLLGSVGKAINDYFEDKDDDIAGYQRGDNYMLLLKGNEDEILYKLTTLDYELTQIQFLDNTTLNFSYGIKVTSSKYALELYQELDKAKFAEKCNKDPNENYFFFNEEMEKRQQEADELNARFESALENDEFEVFFQLKWDLRSNDWGGAEALVRWRNPDHGLISPGKFIPLYEENGNITKLDAFVFEKTCRLISEMLDRGERVVPVSINLSKRNFANMAFMPAYQAVVDKYKIPHELIEFEITEGLLMDNLEAFTRFIKIFHENDYGIAMDDFGSGYSSLNMIHNLDFDIIKIDARFFRDGFDESSKTIVKSVISLCHKLGKTVVAEGIEYSHEVSFLKEAKCDIIQGYYFAKPLPFDDFKKLLSSRPENT